MPPPIRPGPIPVMPPPIRPGDVVRHEQPGGGGHGDPALRDPAAILRDLADGKITAEHARQFYRFGS